MTTTQRTTDVPGPVLFARYAYPPNRLGLCGPDDAPALADSAAAAAGSELRHLAAGFEGAFPYLQLIATENGIADPLDRRVVEAYWLGGALADRVPARPFHRHLVERFRGRVPRRDWPWLEAAVGGGGRPIHAFHVLEVFPRIGLLRGGEADGVLATLDACRIRWGRVMGVTGADSLVVETRRLQLDHGGLRLGPPAPETVRGWHVSGATPGAPQPGDWVSIHWGWACDRLDARQLARLARWTHAAIASANRAI